MRVQGGYSEGTVWYSEGTVRVESGYSKDTVGYSEGTVGGRVRVH